MRLKSYFVNRDLYDGYRAAARIITAEQADEVGLFWATTTMSTPCGYMTVVK
jgi:hypothetical protein